MLPQLDTPCFIDTHKRPAFSWMEKVEGRIGGRDREWERGTGREVGRLQLGHEIDG